MKLCVSLVLCIVAYLSQDAVNCQKMPPSRTTASKPSASGKVTHKSHDATSFPTRTQKTVPSHIPKSSGKVPTEYTKIPTSRTLKTSVMPTIGTTSSQKPKPPISGPTSAKPPKSSPPQATTVAKSKTTQNSTRTSKVATSASKTLTVSDGQTASAQVGWIVIGLGVGGSVYVGGNIIPIAGGTEGIIEENSSGQDEVVPIDTSTAPTRTDTSTTRTSTSSTSTSTSKSKSKSKSTSKLTSSSTSSSTASPTPYNIYPKLDSTARQQLAFAQDLEQVAQPGSVKSITGARDKLLLWVASLTPAQASDLSRNPVVRGLNVDQALPDNLESRSENGTPPSPDCPSEKCSHQKRDGTILMQQGARDELKMFSQARGAYLSGLPGYAYDSRAGQGITVYVVDTGINPNHPEFTNMRGSLRWLYIPGEPQIQSDENGHGTCVVSKVMGPTFGVAKSANIVVVKVPPINDIASNNLQGRAVFTTTVDVYANTLSEDEKVTYTACVRDLIDLDVVVVVASGNVAPDRPELALSTYPGLLAAQYPIVVVGGVQPSGIYAPYSQGFASELTVSADGYVRCADYRGGSSWWQGTSFSTPAVAGLAAYFMSLDQYRGQLQVQGSVARNVRDLIKSLGYARRPLQPAVVWNGIDSRQIACPVRRDTRSSGCPARNTTLPIVPPATPPPNTAKARSTTIATSSSKPPTSSITTDSSTTTGGEISSSITLTIPLGGFVTISESSMTGDLPVPTNAPGAINLPT